MLPIKKLKPEYDYLAPDTAEVRLLLTERDATRASMAHCRLPPGATSIVEIHPPDLKTRYDHIHLYDYQGQSLDSNLQVGNYRDPSVHIQIAPDDFNYGQVYHAEMTKRMN